MSRTKTVKMLLVAAGLVLATMSATRADDDDHDFAKRALEQGRALPLADIIAKISPQVPGKVIEVELDDEDGTLVYDLKVGFGQTPKAEWPWLIHSVFVNRGGQWVGVSRTEVRGNRPTPPAAPQRH